MEVVLRQVTRRWGLTWPGLNYAICARLMEVGCSVILSLMFTQEASACGYQMICQNCQAEDYAAQILAQIPTRSYSSRLISSARRFAQAGEQAGVDLRKERARFL